MIRNKTRPTYTELEQHLAEAHQLIAALRKGEVDAIITELDVALLRARKLEAELSRSEENFRISLEESPLGIHIVNADEETLYANQALLDIYGYDSIEELKVTPAENRYTAESYVEYQKRKENRKRGEYVPSEYEISIVRKDGKFCHLETFRKEVLWNGKTQFQVLYHNITERKRAEEYQKMVTQVLELLNKSVEKSDIIRDIILLIKELTGFEAVGIRLKEGEDFPYYQTSGFPSDFVKAERYLCARDQTGELIRDSKGNPYLECMCGNVICERTNPSLPFFTTGGSFWTNSTTELLASTTEEDRQARTRNRCNGEGYESVALIPLRSDSKIIGLLQLNDSRKGMFTLEIVSFFERIGDSIGIALARKQAEEALRRHAERLRNLHKIDQAILMAIESPEAIAQAALLHLRGLLHCERASVGTFDLEKKEVRVFAADVNGETIMQTGKALSEEAYGDLEILRQGRMEIVENMSKVTSLSAVARILQTEGIRSSINMPLLSAKGLIGALNIGWEEPRAITPEDMEIAREVAGQISIAIEHARLLQETKRYAAELEDRVRERTAQLETTNKELESFSYSVSHDLRAPLRHIMGFVELLKDRATQSLDEQSLHYMNVIWDSTNKMGTLIDDLLSFSRMGRADMMKTKVNLNQLVKEAINTLEAETKARDIIWKVDQLPEVHGDSAMLRLVLVNLISNALKFTRKQPQARVEIGCCKYTNIETPSPLSPPLRVIDPQGREVQETVSIEGGEHTPAPLSRGDISALSPGWRGLGRGGFSGEIIFYVKDNGVGFDMQYSNKLFGLFKRLHSANDFEGTGVGLANVKRIIQRHGGRTWAEGKVDEGATFYFSLTRKDISDAR